MDLAAKIDTRRNPESQSAWKQPSFQLKQAQLDWVVRGVREDYGLDPVFLEQGRIAHKFDEMGGRCKYA
jgi:hypothetical protein